jgi:DNA-binding Lrp family transcriptional regulator
MSDDDTILVGKMTSIDALDVRLIRLLAEDARMPAVMIAQRLGTSRNTVQARLARLRTSGHLHGFLPSVDLPKLGWHVQGYVQVELAQGWLDRVISDIVDVPEVVEAYATAGPADLVCRVVARSHDDLQRVLQSILSVEGVTRTTTSIILSTPLRPRLPFAGPDR